MSLENIVFHKQKVKGWKTHFLRGEGYFDNRGIVTLKTTNLKNNYHTTEFILQLLSILYYSGIELFRDYFKNNIIQKVDFRFVNSQKL